MRNAYESHAYRKKTKTLRRHVERTGQPCWLCHKPIDLTLPPRHPQSFSADHVDPLGNGGKLLGELRPAHFGCNSARGKMRTSEQVPKPKTSRQW
jgi:hypothetical protein